MSAMPEKRRLALVAAQQKRRAKEKIMANDPNWPECMAPDGGQACAAFVRITARCAALQDALKVCDYEMEQALQVAGAGFHLSGENMEGMRRAIRSADKALGTTGQCGVGDYYDEAAKAYAALAKIITTYDAYRGRGAVPAPTEYQDVVAAIHDARKIMAPQFRDKKPERWGRHVPIVGSEKQ